MLPCGMRNSKASDGSSPAAGLRVARACILTGEGAKAGISWASKPEAIYENDNSDLKPPLPCDHTRSREGLGDNPERKSR